MAERGRSFIAWQWTPVEGATGYEAHAFPAGTAPSERPPLQLVAEPMFRAEGLEPGTSWGFFARAVRDTAGGRDVGPWSQIAMGETRAEPGGLELLAAVTGVQVAERGQHFIVWRWDPVEGASGYDVHAFRAGTPNSERPSLEFVTGPTFRKEGLEPGTAWEFFARAVRDTARGREVGPWSVGARRETWGEGEMWGEPRQCSDEREMALAFGTPWGPHRPVEAWDGEPIQVYFDEAAVRPEERGRVKEWFDGVERLSDVIQDQIGYSILELGGWIGKERRGFGMKTDRLSDCRPRRRQIVVTVVGWQDYASAHGSCGAVLMPRSELFDGWSGDGVVAHEIWHLLGFTHHRKSGHPWQTPEGEGVQMSLELTHPSRDDRQDLSVTYEDVDALRCIFPKSGG